MSENNYKLIGFKAENFMRIKAIEFKPDGTLQIIGGENSQGKTSITNAIFAALQNASASKKITKPIREGEDFAEVTLDFGDITVTRTWEKDKDSKLVVRSALGAKFEGGQTLLNSLLGRLSFDPLDFMRLEPKKQVSALLDVVGLNEELDKLMEEREKQYNARTIIGREVDAAKAALDKLGEAEDEVEPVVVSDLLWQLEEWRKKNERKNAHETRIEELRVLLIETQSKLDAERSLLAALGEVGDGLELNRQIVEAEAINEQVKRNAQRKELTLAFEVADNRYEICGDAIRRIDGEKEAKLKEAHFPIEGLDFSDTDGVLFNGVPLSQCSASEQIKVTFAVAMALNPTVKMIFIQDGSLLDKKSMELLYQMALDNRYQVFVERVGDGDEAALVIENGEVRV